MKKILLFITAACFYQVQAQNLITNPGFETYSALPTGVAQVSLATGWNTCYGGGSADYFHVNGSGIVKLPNCFVGTVNPHSGGGIVGGALWYYSPTNYREYIATKLTSPMVVNQTYTISFYITNGVTGGTYGGGGIDNISVAFSMDSLRQPGTGPITRTPQWTYGAVFYSHAWQLTSFQYTADSAYQYFTLGNFKNDAGTTYQQFDPCSAYGAYYFFDDFDVELSGATLPVANFTSSDTTFCSETGKCIDFTDHSTGNPTSWKWYFPGAQPDSSDLQNPLNICYYTPGTYPVTLIVTNAAGTDTVAVSPMITLANPPAVPTAWLSNDTLFCSHAASYQWYFNGAPIAGATDSFYVYSAAGTYSVLISDGNGCSVLSSGMVITEASSPVPFSKGEGVAVYPNPVGSALIVHCANCIGKDFQVEIYNVIGEKVASFSPLFRRGVGGEADISSLPKGVYFVQLFDGDRVYRTKFIKD